MPTACKFKLKYPQFEQYERLDDNLIELFLCDAIAEMDRTRWGNLYERGALALTAHLLVLHFSAMDNGGRANQALASESAGELSVSYVSPVLNSGDDFYQTTAYGQEYLRLRKLIGVGFMVV